MWWCWKVYVIHFEIHFGEVEGQLLTPPHQYAYSPYCPLNISKGADKENLFTNQEFLCSMIISLILVTLMFDSGVILSGEISCQSWHLRGLKV